MLKSVNTTGGLPSVTDVALASGRQRLKKSFVGYVGKQKPAAASEPPYKAMLVKLCRHFTSCGPEGSGP